MKISAACKQSVKQKNMRPKDLTLGAHIIAIDALSILSPLLGSGL